jgi:hypothetical protein
MIASAGIGILGLALPVNVVDPAAFDGRRGARQCLGTSDLLHTSNCPVVNGRRVSGPGWCRVSCPIKQQYALSLADLLRLGSLSC